VSSIWYRLRQLILAICAIYIGFSLFGAVVYFGVQPNISRIELSKLLFELSLWGAIPVFLVLLILRAWRLALASLIIVGVFAFVYLPYLIPRNPAVTPTDTTLRIMTFNTLATARDLATIIEDADPDIVALQELSPDGTFALRNLDDIYPYRALQPVADPTTGQGILSKYPIISDEFWTYPDLPNTLGHQRIEVDVDGQTVVIYNTHPWPPLAWQTGFNDESHRVALNDVAQRSFDEDEDTPIILVGDFNMTPVFEEYALLNSRYTDSFRVAGDGLGYTFPNNKFRSLPRLLRLDYIWHSDHFQSIESTVWHNPGESDHSPVVSTLMLIDE